MFKAEVQSRASLKTKIQIVASLTSTGYSFVSGNSAGPVRHRCSSGSSSSKFSSSDTVRSGFTKQSPTDSKLETQIQFDTTEQ